MAYQNEHSQKELQAGFDRWAQTYDQDVAAPAEGFPFAGYARALEKVYQKAKADTGMSILDLGVGTGNLSKYFIRGRL